MKEHHNCPTMHFGIQFQYKPEGRSRPIDASQEEELSFDVPYGTPLVTVPIPNVGDTVSVSLEPDEKGNIKRKPYKVLTRHFGYSDHENGLTAWVNIVVTDVAPDEMAARLKE